MVWILIRVPRYPVNENYGKPERFLTLLNTKPFPFKSFKPENKFTPGKKIKIISFDNLKKIDFDYIIILAWNFAPSIIKKLRLTINKKFKIIVPFPKLIIK